MNKARLRWACRRGMLELDLLLLPFLEQQYDQLTLQQQQDFQQLLSCQDQDLYQWLLGRGVPDQENLQAVAQKVKQHAQL